jgi:hypothetical protein
MQAQRTSTASVSSGMATACLQSASHLTPYSLLQFHSLAVVANYCMHAITTARLPTLHSMQDGEDVGLRQGTIQ